MEAAKGVRVGVEGHQANPYWEAGAKDTKTPSQPHNPTLLWELPSFPSAVVAAASGGSANTGGPFPPSALDRGEENARGARGSPLISNVL